MTRMLKRVLSDILTDTELEQLISAFDQIGEIIIVRIPDSLYAKRYLIGETLLKNVKTAKSVFYQASAVEGEHRVRDLELLVGVNSTETEYKELGCRFRVDVQNAFFSPRLSNERERIANLVQDGEIVLNMFGGVGMFSIIAAKYKSCSIYNIDINPIATKLCQINIERNKLLGRVISLNGDATQIVSDIPKADRTLMLLPERSFEFLSKAIYATKPGGIIHYYLHTYAKTKSDVPKLAKEQYIKETTVPSEILGSKVVRAVGPRWYQAVVDVKINHQM